MLQSFPCFPRWIDPSRWWMRPATTCQAHSSPGASMALPASRAVGELCFALLSCTHCRIADDNNEMQCALCSVQKAVKQASCSIKSWRPGSDQQSRAADAHVRKCTWCRQTEQAGDRAMRILPAMFALVENCVEALAVDTACAEDAGDGDNDEDGASLPVLSERCAAE